MGAQIDKAGTTGSAGLTKISKAGAVTGAAIASLVGTLTLASRANAEAEASQARLETAIENTGHSMFEYEAALKAASEAALQLGFDDEDAADSIAKLTTATGDAERAIEDLSLAEDIARARKISLSQATQIVIAAEQERFGALARVGIQVDENATKEQALDALRAQFAGNAERYAETEAASYDRRKNQLENYMESVGAALGPFQELLLIAPGVSASFTGVGAAVGAIAPNLTKAAAAAALFNVALGPVGIVAAAVAAAGALLYFGDSLDDQFVPDTEAARTSLAALTDEVEGFVAASSPLTPLAQDVADSLTYITNASENAQGALQPFIEAEAEAVAELDNAKKAFGENSESVDFFRLQLGLATAELEKQRRAQDQNIVSGEKLEQANEGVLNILRQTGTAGELVRSELANLYADQQAGIITWEQYLDGIIRVNGALPEIVRGLTETESAVDGTTTAMDEGTAAVDAYAAGLTRATDGVHNLGIGFRDGGEAGAAWNTSLADGVRAQNDAAAAARDHEAALKEQEGAYYRVRDGVISASDAQAIFAQTQQGIVTAQGPYNKQLSDYNTQLGNLEAAEQLLNDRKAAGITLTAEQESFLGRVDAAQERLTGGTEDATLALGEQALQYAENMRLGDEMNQGLGTLDTSIQELISALQGIPGFVKTNIEVDAEDAKLQADIVKRQLDALQGRTSYASVVVTGYYTGPNVGLTPGQQHGGVVPHAQHGLVNRDARAVLVGESGPEVVTLPGGSYTTPAPASRLRMGSRGGGGGGDIIVTGPVYLYPASTDVYDALRSQLLAEARS